jgi:hypothetical protein
VASHYSNFFAEWKTSVEADPKCNEYSFLAAETWRGRQDLKKQLEYIKYTSTQLEYQFRKELEDERARSEAAQNHVQRLEKEREELRAKNASDLQEEKKIFEAEKDKSIEYLKKQLVGNCGRENRCRDVLLFDYILHRPIDRTPPVGAGTVWRLARQRLGAPPPAASVGLWREVLQVHEYFQGRTGTCSNAIRRFSLHRGVEIRQQAQRPEGSGGTRGRGRLGAVFS